MIPDNITSEHIEQAIVYIDENGLPPNRISIKYILKYEGKDYPPKYVISIANKFANGVELDPEEFKGGKETNNFLQARGFNIACNEGNTHKVKLPKTVQSNFNKELPSKTEHEVELSALEISSMRTQVVQLLNQIDPNPKKNAGVKGRINIMVSEEKIPRETAPSFHTITEMRNVTEYKDKVLSDSEHRAILASWDVIKEWAVSKGYRIKSYRMNDKD